MGHDTGALAKQVRQHAGVAHRDVVTEVRDHEMHLETSRRTAQAPLRHHPTQPEARPGGHLPGGHLAWVEEERDVLTKGAERERAGDAHSRHDAEHQDHAAPARRHRASPCVASRRRASARDCASARRAHTMLSTITATVTA